MSNPNNQSFDNMFLQASINDVIHLLKGLDFYVNPKETAKLNEFNSAMDILDNIKLRLEQST